MNFPMIKKYPHLIYLLFCRVHILHTFPDDILDKYSLEKLSYPYRGIRFTITQHLFSTISVLNLKRSGQGTGYGERKKKKKLKALILVLGLLQVVGTVKLKALILLLGLLQVVGTVKKLKALILVLGLLQVVGTVKILNYRLCLQ